MKPLFRNIIWSLSVLFVAGCVTPMKLNPEEKAFLEKVKTAPLEFNVSKEEVTDAWGRAQSYVGQYSSMKLQTATDFVIQTYNPVMGDAGWGYSATKTPMGKEFKISVKCLASNMFVKDLTESNARIFANYVKTGEMPPDVRLIHR